MGLRPASTAPLDGTEVIGLGTIYRGDDMDNRVLYACITSYHDDWRKSPAHVAGWYFQAPGYTTSLNLVWWAPIPAEVEMNEYGRLVLPKVG
jgi:hypothetical protein